MERKYFTGSMPLLTPNHCSKTCGGSVALTSIEVLKKCDAKTSSGRQERYILKTNVEFPYHIYIIIT